MGWLAEHALLEKAAALYRRGYVTTFDGLIVALSQSEGNLITSEKAALTAVVLCEVFAAISQFPSQELAGSVPKNTIDYLTWPYERLLWNIDKVFLTALEKVQASGFIAARWSADMMDLRRRLEKVSARYESHRQNPSRGVSIYNDATGEWLDAEQNSKP